MALEHFWESISIVLQLLWLLVVYGIPVLIPLLIILFVITFIYGWVSDKLEPKHIKEERERKIDENIRFMVLRAKYGNQADDNLRAKLKGRYQEIHDLEFEKLYKKEIYELARRDESEQQGEGKA